MKLLAGLPPFRSTAVLLLALLVAINGLAVGTLLTARGRVRDAADREMVRRTERRARALEASLSATRGDLLFLAQSGSLRRLAATLADPDPYRSRWHRLDAEAAGLLFLRSHPVVARLVVTDGAGNTLFTVGRRGGAPITLSSPDAADRPEHTVVPPADAEPALRLLVDLDPQGLLGSATGDEDGATRLEPAGTAASPVSPGTVEASAAVRDQGWEPAVEWTLRRREAESDLLRTVEHLAADYRDTVALNAALIALASALGWMALREVRAVERLQAAQENTARVRDLELGLLHRDRLAGLGRVAAGIAHEINNPLEGMSNYLRLAEEDLAAGDPAGAGRNLGRVREGLDRVADVVRQALNQAGDGRGAKERLDLRDVAERTVDFARDDARARGVGLHYEAPGSPVPANANATTLGQLLLNLVLNACEAQPTGGEVRVTVTAGNAGPELRIEDRGPGIAGNPADLFEPFYSTKGSAGLGLFLCQSIAADHGGTLRAENRESGGARFILQLPPPADEEPA